MPPNSAHFASKELMINPIEVCGIENVEGWKCSHTFWVMDCKTNVVEKHWVCENKSLRIIWIKKKENTRIGIGIQSLYR